jgi:XTP/dITP diphosphohydrolase
MRLVFATHNRHKAAEVQKILSEPFEVITLTDLNILEDIPETGSNLQANALIKARFVHQLSRYNCFADDTGLEVEALNGEPGVHSARYAGEQKNDDANITKLLHHLQDARTEKHVLLPASACFGKMKCMCLKEN